MILSPISSPSEAVVHRLALTVEVLHKQVELVAVEQGQRVVEGVYEVEGSGAFVQVVEVVPVVRFWMHNYCRTLR